MSQPSPEIEAKARERLAADEEEGLAAAEQPAPEPVEEVTGSRRTSQSMGAAWRQFWGHPSPWLIGAFLLGAIAYRATLLTFDRTELVVPVALVALFPVIEWVIHVVILHWRPRKVGGLRVDSLLSRKHRAHHADPQVLPLVFIPWQVELWLLPSYVVLALLAFPGEAAGATFLVSVGALMFNYEWVHFLVHSDHRPRTRAFRAVWRNHRLHHYKNEHYWFTVTSAGTADRLFGTYPEAGDMKTSPTVRRLHVREDERIS
ncbi:MAG: sterol desaturase family protein [Marmoricola sp.]